MKPLENLVASPVAASIGWTLLHSLWEGVVISGVLAAVLTLLRAPRARYVAACAAMLAMLSLFGLTLVRMAPGSAHTVRAITPISTVGSSQSDKDLAGPWKPNLSAAVPWLAPLWLAGVLLMFARHFAACLSVRRFRSHGVCSAPDRWQNELARLSARLRIFRPVQLLESCVADSPMVLGHFRPVILMPVGLLAGLSPAQVESIFLHELAHIRRHDYLVNTIQRVVEGLLFYHPAVWWISGVMRTEREHCCDDTAVSISGNAHEYAVALATLEQNRLSGKVVVAATGGNLVKRIHRLLYPKANSAWAPFLAVVILVVIGAATVAAWPAKTQQEKASAIQPETQPALKPVYSKWLNEDVFYIIDDAERTAFLRFTTDKERDKFVEQFWLRRDPTNKFKEEHYRRLAYANQHFASGVPGWQTDRGHIYIVYGPPDEKESHPRGTKGSTEVWLYHHVEGIGDNGTITFIDSTGHGDFRLAPGAPLVKEK